MANWVNNWSPRLPFPNLPSLSLSGATLKTFSFLNSIRQRFLFAALIYRYFLMFKVYSFFQVSLLSNKWVIINRGFRDGEHMNTILISNGKDFLYQFCLNLYPLETDLQVCFYSSSDELVAVHIIFLLFSFEFMEKPHVAYHLCHKAPL